MKNPIPYLISKFDGYNLKALQSAFIVYFCIK